MQIRRAGPELPTTRHRHAMTRSGPRQPAYGVWNAALRAALFLLGPAEASAAEPVRLRLSFQLPLTGTLGVNLVQLKAAVARDTGNAVAIEILHGKEALPDRAVAKSVMAGDIEMAAANVVTLADKVKGVDVLSLPFLFNSHAFLKGLMRADLCCDHAADGGAGYRPF